MKGILFNEPTGMMQAVINGDKTMTRRIIKPQPDDDGLWDHTEFPMSLQSKLQGYVGTVESTGESRVFKPRYNVGETIFIKESHFKASYSIGCPYVPPKYWYRIDHNGKKDNNFSWSNPMFCGEDAGL